MTNSALIGTKLVQLILYLALLVLSVPGPSRYISAAAGRKDSFAPLLFGMAAGSGRANQF